MSSIRLERGDKIFDDIRFCTNKTKCLRRSHSIVSHKPRIGFFLMKILTIQLLLIQIRTLSFKLSAIRFFVNNLAQQIPTETIASVIIGVSREAEGSREVRRSLRSTWLFISST